MTQVRENMQSNIWQIKIIS